MELGRANGASPDGRAPVLVVANRTLASNALRKEIAERAPRRRRGAADRPDPVFARALHRVRHRRRAARRARAPRRLLAWASEHDVRVTGAVGDPNVALGAIEDELRRSAADEVLISTHPPKQSNWLETGIVTRLREELDIPVTHLVGRRRARRGDAPRVGAAPSGGTCKTTPAPAVRVMLAVSAGE